MSTTFISVKTGKNLLLLCMIPFLFACSKSKFSAVKTPPATVEETNTPTPDVDYNDDDDYHDNDDHDCRPDCNHPCKQPPVDECRQYGRNCPQPPPVDECRQYGRNCPQPPPVIEPCPPQECQYGHNPNGTCKPRPPQCQYGQLPNGQCKPAPVQPCTNGCQPTPPPQDCVEYEHQIPEYDGPRGVNVWVVMDGSKSNAAERADQMAALAEMYERNLARRIPITISVITGHSRKSADSALSGNTFFRKDNSDPAVLVLNPSMSSAQRAAALNGLRNKILGMRTDNSRGVSDGGELLVANLYAALSEQSIARAKQARAFGEGNILNIHFIADENDVCTPIQGASTAELQAYNEECRGRNGRPNLAANSEGFSSEMYNRIVKVSNDHNVQIHLTGFVYTSSSTMPKVGQNSLGHGYIQLIQKTEGMVYDLGRLTSLESRNVGARELIRHINVGAQMYPAVPLDRTAAPFAMMDAARTSVTVDGQPVQYRTDSSTNTMYLYGCPVDGRRAVVKYCRQRN